MFDVIVVGSGIAGLCAAIEAKNAGSKVAIISKTYPTKSQSCMAQGGINAVLNDDIDSVESHIDDTYEMSYKEANRENIKYLCENAKSAIEWLELIGVPFSRDENGGIAQRKLGGASKARACYAQDYTGLKILHTLYDHALSLEIPFFCEKLLVEILRDGDSACGVALLDYKSSKLEKYFAKSLILATGGYASIYRGFTTNSSSASGESLIVAKNAGCKLSNLEFIQFHPTALKNSKVLISESARGAGGYLLDSKGERFIDELLPRDKISQEIFKKISNGESVYLDIRHLGEDFINQNLPQERKLAKIYEGIDVAEEIIPIEPAAHYSMGGIESDIDCKTSLDSLFVCGECAQSSLHGANRLGGNSLLEAVVFGKKAGKNAHKNALEVEKPKEVESTFSINSYFEQKGEENLYRLRDEVGEILNKNVGIIREESQLKEALEQLNSLKNRAKNISLQDRGKIYNTNLHELIEFRFQIDLGIEIAKSALERKESVGAHFLEQKR